HTVSAIAKNPGIHISGLALYFGYTRGAVSEVVRKLEKKGLIVKQTDPENSSRLNLYLTNKGRTAQREHQRYHEMVSNLILGILKGMPSEHVEIIRVFLRALAEGLSFD
ncbi:MAG TPA: MarR family winged helix-turn-helix transcriptional regulator, partial [bacterium]|nr:MarR family winged helix-turn-helix transcriptional regulator [bacterium]